MQLFPSASCNSSHKHEKGILYLIQLKNGPITVGITNIGCSITSIETPGKDGSSRNIVAGYTSLPDYFENPSYFGCLLGRFANRIAGAEFKLDGLSNHLSANDGANHLHGGTEGFSKQVWKVERLIQNEYEAGVELSYLSPDGEEGYPGNLQVTVQYILNDRNQLLLKYHAQTDKPTIVSLANHSYFNLSGFDRPTILNHHLRIISNRITVSPGDLPNGQIMPVMDTELDFSAPREIGFHKAPFLDGTGYNQNYILKDYRPGKVVLASRLTDPESGRVLSVYTDQPGLQLYTAGFWNGHITGPQGKPYEKYGAVALETQLFPDSPNQAWLPDGRLAPGEVYKATTVYEFKVNQTF